MKTEKEIKEALTRELGCGSSYPIEGLLKEVSLIQKEAYLQGQLDEFKENQLRTNKLLERFGI